MFRKLLNRRGLLRIWHSRGEAIHGVNHTLPHKRDAEHLGSLRQQHGRKNITPRGHVAGLLVHQPPHKGANGQLPTRIPLDDVRIRMKKNSRHDRDALFADAGVVSGAVEVEKSTQQLRRSSVDKPRGVEI